jgi:hypothetical protein
MSGIPGAISMNYFEGKTKLKNSSAQRQGF